MDVVLGTYNVVADGDGYDVRADYATELFTADDASAMLRQWLAALDLVAAAPAMSVAALGRRLRQIA